jgi:hypothetical protein
MENRNLMSIVFLIVIALILFILNFTYGSFGISYIIWNSVLHILTFLIIFSSMAYGLLLKNIKIRRYLLIGYFLVGVSEVFYLLSIFLKEYVFLHSDTILWSIGILGVFFVMQGFKEGEK